ncbi:OLC1v1026094C1 [Oldenlandia corymbosa var. corymbosa]|uniref:OLC1v1026094C1 n=1 Tax=Oldenlandia corymbosa var. corymbosa TaxID=529605 RepID=A0AAV1C821_OLDCO|nr:OLC1v1026094C1 [Oldenlandia corymbosa var. corymbosa]
MSGNHASSTRVLIAEFVVVLLLLFSPHFIPILLVMCRPIPATNDDGNLSTNTTIGFRPNKNRQVGHGGQEGSQQSGDHGTNNNGLENCLPKGFRPKSAPSRYINFVPFTSTLCSTGPKEKKNEP